MTKEEALLGCIDMWETVKNADHTEFPGIGRMKYTVYPNDWNMDCAMCYYDNIHGAEDCDNCLIKAIVWEDGCMTSGPYAKLAYPEDKLGCSFQDISKHIFQECCQEIIDACHKVLAEL